MKRRKTFVGMTILLAILVLGVGYAAVSDIPLILNGTANVKANADFSVQYDTGHTVVVTPANTQITWDDSDVRDVVDGKYVDTEIATMTVNLDSEHRTATAIYKIDNLSEELKATITSEITTDFDETKADYLTVTQGLYTTDACDELLENKEVAPGESAYLKVTVSLTKLPVEDINDAQFTITTTAQAVEVELGE